MDNKELILNQGFKKTPDYFVNEALKYGLESC